MKQISLAVATALAVCSAPSYAGWTSAEVDFGGLKAYVYTPSAAAPAAGRMLFINLHGCGQKDTDLVKSNWSGVAEKHNAVVVVPAVGHGVIAGCYDYGNTNSTPNMVDAAALVKGTRDMLANSTYKIDKAQVYMTGISAGGAYAQAVACANPDLYAGVGNAAGPTLKSSQGSAISGSGDANAMVAWCQQQAGSKVSEYKTQLWAQTYGAELPSSDGLCSPKFIEPNHKAAQLLLGLSGGVDHESDTKAPNPTAGHTTVEENEHYIKDANGAKRIALIEIPGMGHNWPGGTGSTGSYVSPKFDFGMWMAENFTKNNCRIAANQGTPACGGVIDKPLNLLCSVTKDSARLTWAMPQGAGYDGYVVKNVTDNTEQRTTATNSLWSNLTTNKKYSFSVAGMTGSVVHPSAVIDCTPSGIATPELTVVASSTSAQLTWKAISGAAKYSIYRNSSLVGSATATSYTDSPLTPSTQYTECVTALSSGGEESGKACQTFTTPPITQPPVSGTCTQHYLAKRLDLNGYLACGKKYGYINALNMYQCGSTWTDQANCGARSF